MHTIDTIALSARLGWMPSYPQFDRNPLDVPTRPPRAGDAGAPPSSAQLQDGRCGFAIETPTRRRTGRAA